MFGEFIHFELFTLVCFVDHFTHATRFERTIWQVLLLGQIVYRIEKLDELTSDHLTDDG